MNTPKTLLHGGDIVSASELYNIPIDDWIDLSTGINPVAYPVDKLFRAEGFKQSLQNLPYLQPDFIKASTDYYQSSQFVAVAGTQAAIQQLPSLLHNFPVCLPQVGYQEHAQYWAKYGSTITYYPSMEHDESCKAIQRLLDKNNQQHVVVINPNNPTGVLFEVEQLLAWAQQLAPNAYLIIDEAFIDVTPKYSVLGQGATDNDMPHNIIVLRSFGKFFGLAGLRLGYCFTNESVLQQLQKKIGLWQVNGVAQFIAAQALRDTQWHRLAIGKIKCAAKLTQEIFSPLMNNLSTSILPSKIFTHYDDYNLFLSYPLPYVVACKVQNTFAQSGVLLRLIKLDDEKSLLRIGLLGDSSEVLERVKSVVLQYDF